MTEPTLVKMSVLSKMSGVPTATIKHYVREGLLPTPKRTSRNMAYYDVRLVSRIQRIKEMQRRHFLPLKVIREVLDGPEAASADETVAASIARALASERIEGRRTRAELIRAGVPKEQLAWLEGNGIVTPSRRGGADGFEGDDLELLRVLGAARAAGLTEGMLPVEILGEYADALGRLVRIELELFRTAVVPTAGERLPELTEVATRLSERLIVILRRKLLLPTLATLTEGSAPFAKAGPARKKRKRRSPR